MHVSRRGPPHAAARPDHLPRRRDCQAVRPGASSGRRRSSRSVPATNPGETMNHLGQTRSTSQRNHAVLTPDTFVRAPLPGMVRATAIVHAAPAVGAGFTQYTAEFEPGGSLGSDLRAALCVRAGRRDRGGGRAQETSPAGGRLRVSAGRQFRCIGHGSQPRRCDREGISAAARRPAAKTADRRRGLGPRRAAHGRRLVDRPQAPARGPGLRFRRQHHDLCSRRQLSPWWKFTSWSMAC